MGTRRQRKTVEMSRITKECNCDFTIFIATHILSLVLRRHVRVLSTFSASRLASDGGDADDGAAVARGGAPSNIDTASWNSGYLELRSTYKSTILCKIELQGTSNFSSSTVPDLKTPQS